MFADEIPKLEEAEKIRTRIGKLAMSGIGGLLLVERAFARILNAQSRGDDEQFAGGVLALRLQQHATQRGINRQSGEVASELG